MADFGDFLRIVGGGVLSGLGTSEQQKAEAERQRAAAEKRREFDILRQDEAARLAELKRQHDLQYGTSDFTLPPELGGMNLSGPRWAMPAMIQGVIGRERELSPEEIGALGTIRERVVSPAAGEAATAEARATKKAFPQFETSPLTVDIPQGVRLPRQVIERTMTEAAQIRKEQDTERRANLQRKADARFRELYETLVPTVGHNVAQATAIQTVQKELGISPSRETFVTAPRETAERMPNLEQAATGILLNVPENQRTPQQKAVVDQYRTVHPGPDIEMVELRKKLAKIRVEAGEAQRDAGNIIQAIQQGRPVNTEVATRVQQRLLAGAQTYDKMFAEKPELQDLFKAAKEEMMTQAAFIAAYIKTQRVGPGGGGPTAGRAATQGDVDAAIAAAKGNRATFEKYLRDKGIDPTLPVQ